MLAELREPADGMDEAIVQRVMSAIAPVKPRRSGTGRAWRWAAAAAAAASLVLALTLWRGAVKPPNGPVIIDPPVCPWDAPTLSDYDRALAQSDEASERLLSHEAERLGFLFAQSKDLSLTEDNEELWQ
jgi:hypothetical protein